MNWASAVSEIKGIGLHRVFQNMQVLLKVGHKNF